MTVTYFVNQIDPETTTPAEQTIILDIPQYSTALDRHRILKNADIHDKFNFYIIGTQRVTRQQHIQWLTEENPEHFSNR